MRFLQGPVNHDKNVEVYLKGMVELFNEFIHRKIFLIDFLPQNDLLSCAIMHLQSIFFYELGHRNTSRRFRLRCVGYLEKSFMKKLRKL